MKVTHLIVHFGPRREGFGVPGIFAARRAQDEEDFIDDVFILLLVSFGDGVYVLQLLQSFVDLQLGLSILRARLSHRWLLLMPTLVGKAVGVFLLSCWLLCNGRRSFAHCCMY